MVSISAVIVAGGKGERMQADIRKQYLELDRLPILSRTLLAFAQIPVIDTICLVVPEKDFDFCSCHVIAPVLNRARIQLIAGGDHRQASVFNGLSAITDPNGIVVIHDGVRPFVPVRPTEEAISWAQQEGACILGIPAVDTLKNVDNKGYISRTIERVGIWQAQTPQVFQYGLVKKAHDRALVDGYIGTDDASLVENVGSRVKIIYGSPNNIKITKPEDLILAQDLLRHYQINDKS